MLTNALKATLVPRALYAGVIPSCYTFASSGTEIIKYKVFMSSIISIFLSLVAAAIFALIGWVGKNVLLKFRLRHMQYLLGDADSVKIVFPTFFSPIFLEDSPGKGAVIPKNILLMPLAEARAISDITKAISIASPKSKIIFQSPEEFVDDGTPFISIGGPSVNFVSENILNEYWSSFELIYPEHYAKNGGVTYKPIIKDHCLVNDFGFLFQTRLNSDTKSLVVCGVWAIGTELATKVYLDALRIKGVKDIRNKVRKGEDIFIVSEGKVSRIWAGAPKIIGWWES